MSVNFCFSDAPLSVQEPTIAEAAEVAEPSKQTANHFEQTDLHIE